jgi:hypothetical protein
MTCWPPNPPKRRFLSHLFPKADFGRNGSLDGSQLDWTELPHHGVPRAYGHPACRAEHRRAALGDRPPHHPARRLRHLPARPQAHRGGLRLGQDRGRPAQDAPSRPAQDPRSTGNSPSRWLPTTSADCPNCWPNTRHAPRSGDRAVGACRDDNASHTPKHGQCTARPRPIFLLVKSAAFQQPASTDGRSGPQAIFGLSAEELTPRLPHSREPSERPIS